MSGEPEAPVETLTPHEITIRIDEDGKPHAMVSYRYRVAWQGRMLVDTIQGPMALSMDKAGRETWIGEVISDVTTIALATIEQMAGEVNILRNENEDVKRELETTKANLVKSVELLKVARSKIPG